MCNACGPVPFNLQCCCNLTLFTLDQIRNVTVITQSRKAVFHYSCQVACLCKKTFTARVCTHVHATQISFSNHVLQTKRNVIRICCRFIITIHICINMNKSECGSCTVEMVIDGSCFIFISPTTALLLIWCNVLNFQVSLPCFN